jgi:H+/Cl- antiporter ClcA
MLSIAPVLSLTFGIVDIVAFTQIKTIKQLVENSKYREAKDKTLLWSIITLVLGGVIVGILLIVAYIKYDELLRSTESMI